MDFLLKLAAFIFTVSVVQSREIVRDVKSFKLNANIIYDCVHIHKQPSLNHPLLQNHTIQMEPSFSMFKQKNQIETETESKKIIECPNGTVPILRNTDEYVANAQYWTENHLNPLTVDSPGTHIAGVRPQDQGPYHGLSAWMSVHDLNLSADQTSYAHIYAGSGVNNEVNFIQTGWMVNPSLFGDVRTWSYAYWKGANGKGCYNTLCPGFIQVSQTDVLSEPVPYPTKGERILWRRLFQDKPTGNWWVTNVRPNGADVDIGYWPKELFDLMDYAAAMVGVGGAVQASPTTGRSPPMGNGNLPTNDENLSARVRKLDIVDSDYFVRGNDEFKLEKLLDSYKCYGLKDGKKSFWYKNINLFIYGGPGGYNCGI